MILKNLLPFLFIASLPLYLNAQDLYRYQLDIKNIEDDQVKVTLLCPQIRESKAVFVMPRVIPGSYAYKEYGRFIKNIRAFDKDGKEIKITQKDNIYYIKKGADRLFRIEYSVNDTWDDSDVRNFIFQPGGSNIEANKNFVINHFCFEGYFEGYKHLPFEVEILKPEAFYGATALPKKEKSPDMDVISATGYDDLADNPVMYCLPDTASFKVGNSGIHITSYSSTGMVKADSLREWLKPLVFSLENFMGTLPVSDYYFMFYFASPEQLVESRSKGLGGYGALEHRQSSFYYLPEESDPNEVKEMVQDIGAHEFLHILTPLNLHSKEIADFNFKDPKMSQHLWLYEGVTEYLSWLVRVQNQLVTREQFFDEFSSKLSQSEKYGLFSFTTMSKNVLADKYQEKYLDVYRKGAVIAMLLDLKLLQGSGGKYGLKHLMQDLMKKYGPNNPFNDDQLFDDIVALSGPEVAEFINRNIKGADPLPLEETLKNAGYRYEEEKSFTVYYIASFSFELNPENKIQVKEVGGSKVDLRAGDIILSVNNEEVSLQNLRSVIDKYFRYNTSSAPVKLRISRFGEEIETSGSPVRGEAVKKHSFAPDPYAKEKEEIILDAWLNGNYIK